MFNIRLVYLNFFEIKIQKKRIKVCKEEKFFICCLIEIIFFDIFIFCEKLKEEMGRDV